MKKLLPVMLLFPLMVSANPILPPPYSQPQIIQMQGLCINGPGSMQMFLTWLETGYQETPRIHIDIGRIPLGTMDMIFTSNDANTKGTLIVRKRTKMADETCLLFGSNSPDGRTLIYAVDNDDQ